MRHLGSRISAYVDGRLAGRDLARAEVHLGSCLECAQRVMAEREVRQYLRGLANAEPPVDLSARILQRPVSDRRRQRHARVLDWLACRPRRRGAIVAGGAVVATFTGIVLLGSTDVAVGPAAASGAGRHRPVDSTEMTAEVLRAEGWILPVAIPADLHIAEAAVHREGEVLEVEIVGASGSARLREMRGGVDQIELPRDAELVECGGVVAVVTGEENLRTRVAALLPAVDSSLAGRFDRGVQTIVSYFHEVTP